MGGGSIQLSIWGSQNKHLMGNPSLTFFKKVYKTHTNFAMETITVPFNKTDAFIRQRTVLKTKIPRNGDLIAQIYFVFDLPPVVSDSFTRFRWLENIGEAIIYEATLSIGNVIVDKQTGEYMNIYNNITLPSYRREMYNKMIGNITALTNPLKEKVLDKMYKDNAIRVTKIYPTEGNVYNPTLPGHTCYVPLQFYFNRTFSNSLPIIALQYMDVEITIEIRPIRELYQLYYYPHNSNIGEYRAPDENNPNHSISKYVSNELTKYIRDEALIDINARLEVNYIFLDKEERDRFVNKPLEYLIDQVTRVDRYNLSEFNVVDLNFHNLVKEFYWVYRRNDAFVRNAWFDFLDNARNIMVKSRFMFNGVDRIQDKPPQYYNYLIPFQHHTGDPNEGIYCYPFSLHPDEGLEQPSGSCNCSRIDKIQFVTTLQNPNGDYKYDLLFFANSYNILRIHGGIATLFYSL